jgi:hypothetical protein
MKKQTSILTALLFTGVTVFAQQIPKKINIGIVPPLSSNGTMATKDTNSFSLNAIAGVSAAETGLAIAGFGNFVRHNANGMLIAGFMNTLGGGNGFAVAGFGNFAGVSSGTQIAGFINFGGNVTNSQAAGFINLANKVKGVQISGFMNKAKNVQVQLAGFINIADTAGYQIGFINISKNGEKSISATIDQNQVLLFSLRSGGKFLYGIVGVGYDLYSKKSVYAYEAGLGMHIVNAAPFRLNFEGGYTSLVDFKGLGYYRSTLALYPSIRLADHVDLFAGPSLNYMDTNLKEDVMGNQKYISSWGGKDGDDLHGFYIGYKAGVAIRL